MKVCILNCDYDENPATNGGLMISSILKGYGITEVGLFDCFKGRLPSTLDFDSYIITGSRASVYEDLPWITPLSETLKKIDALGTPVLGICFGYQIVAQTFGGEVKSSGKFEEGFKAITIHKQHSLFESIGSPFMVYQSHGDIVTRLPQGSQELAYNEFSLQAYSFRNFICVQFHPEILPITAMTMATRDGKHISSILGKILPDYALTLKILSNFLSIRRA